MTRGRRARHFRDFPRLAQSPIPDIPLFILSKSGFMPQIPRPSLMKPTIFLLSIAFVACAPKAVLVEEAPSTPSSSVEDTSKPEDTAALPDSGPADNLGLLDPKDLTRLPSSQEMRPTVDTASTKPVMAAPPSDKPPVSAE
ncbi:MAG: hypothetical protein RLZ97_271 [Verrucomicrobiota bacterium]